MGPTFVKETLCNLSESRGSRDATRKEVRGISEDLAMDEIAFNESFTVEETGRDGQSLFIACHLGQRGRVLLGW